MGLFVETIDPLKPCNRHRQLRCYVGFTLLYASNLAVFCYFRWCVSMRMLLRAPLGHACILSHAFARCRYVYPLTAWRAMAKFAAVSAALGRVCGLACVLLGLFNAAVVSVMLQQLAQLVGGLADLLRAAQDRARDAPESQCAFRARCTPLERLHHVRAAQVPRLTSAPPCSSRRARRRAAPSAARRVGTSGSRKRGCPARRCCASASPREALAEAVRRRSEKRH